MSEAARSRRDDVRHEPQLAVPRRDSGSPDPLAELARLVGQDDPFRNMFRPAPAAAPYPDGETRSAGDGPRHPRDEPHPVEPYAEEAYGAVEHGGPEARYDDDRHGYHDGYASDLDAHGYAATGHETDLGHHDPYPVTEPGVHPDAGDTDERLATGSGMAPVLADLWARGEEADVVGAPGLVDPDLSEPDFDGVTTSARRPIAVLAAVLLLTAGGLAAAFLAKGASSSGAAVLALNRDAPTIMAATGPTKVKVDDGSATAPEDQDAALLNKSGTTSSGPVKIVSSEEQPADLGQLPKSDLANGARPLPQPSASPFPEPKKVKTFLVHPDGTMLSADGTAPGQTGAGTAPVPERSGAALPVTPKTAARGGTTPKSVAPPGASASLASAAAPGSIEALAAAPVPGDSAPGPAVPGKTTRQPASPGVHAASAKPSDVAEATSEAGGNYGLQLASSPVEAEANAAFAKLKKKFPSQLGGLTATVHKADTGDKPVYRVRVGGMSQEEAKSLCAQLQGAGGSCFVVHN